MPAAPPEQAIASSEPLPLETARLFVLELFGTAQATLAAEANVCRVDIAAVDGTNWHARITKLFDDPQAGATYTVRFRAKADAPRRIALWGGIDEPDRHGIGLSQDVPLTEAWQDNQYEFQAKDLAADNSIQFNVGDQTGTVWIADFTLTKGARSYLGIGMASGARGEWAAALSDLRRAVEGPAAPGGDLARNAEESLAWLYLAVLELEHGDSVAYRRHSRRMLDRFGTSNDRSELERTAKAGLLVPPTSPEEVARLRAMARAAIERRAGESSGAPLVPAGPRPGRVPRRRSGRGPEGTGRAACGVVFPGGPKAASPPGGIDNDVGVFQTVSPSSIPRVRIAHAGSAR